MINRHNNKKSGGYVMLDFSPLNNGQMDMAELARDLDKSDLWALTNEMIDAMLAMIATSPGQTFGISIFNPSFRLSLGLSHSQLTGAYMIGTLGMAWAASRATLVQLVRIGLSISTSAIAVAAASYFSKPDGVTPANDAPTATSPSRRSSGSMRLGTVM